MYIWHVNASINVTKMLVLLIVRHISSIKYQKTIKFKDRNQWRRWLKLIHNSPQQSKSKIKKKRDGNECREFRNEPNSDEIHPLKRNSKRRNAIAIIKLKIVEPKLNHVFKIKEKWGRERKELWCFLEGSIDRERNLWAGNERREKMEISNIWG